MRCRVYKRPNESASRDGGAKSNTRTYIRTYAAAAENVVNDSAPKFPEAQTLLQNEEAALLNLPYKLFNFSRYHFVTEPKNPPIYERGPFLIVGPTWSQIKFQVNERGLSLSSAHGSYLIRKPLPRLRARAVSFLEKLVREVRRKSRYLRHIHRIHSKDR